MNNIFRSTSVELKTIIFLLLKGWKSILLNCVWIGTLNELFVSILVKLSLTSKTARSFNYQYWQQNMSTKDKNDKNCSVRS